ncbi:MAG: NAD-dependent deacylase [Pseudomonadota bacterium]
MEIPEALLDAVRQAGHVCVLTGAGISAESGVPTFREAQSGLWARFDPLDLATPAAFERDPELIWRWYRWRRELVAGVEPNAGHRALVELAERVKRLTLVTQNVDGLHQRAGSDAVTEFHGNLFVDRCRTNGCAQPADSPDTSGLPRCPVCGGLLSPGVVWFGEAIPETALETALAAASSCDVFLSIGTSSLVYPAAGLIDTAREAGAVTVEINPNPTEQSGANDFALAARSGELLPVLARALSP